MTRPHGDLELLALDIKFLDLELTEMGLMTLGLTDKLDTTFNFSEAHTDSLKSLMSWAFLNLTRMTGIGKVL